MNTARLVKETPRTITGIGEYGHKLTYAFPCTKSGKVKDWSELPGSSKCEINHGQVLTNMGYTLA
jgi:hypothetical protein